MSRVKRLLSPVCLLLAGWACAPAYAGQGVGVTPLFALDADGDGLCASTDNCPDIFNPDQVDADSDGVGDACTDCNTNGTPDENERTRSVLLVCNANPRSLLVFDGQTGQFVRTFFSIGGSGEGHPNGLEIGQNGDVFVSINANSVIRYDGATASPVWTTSGGNLQGSVGIVLRGTRSLLVSSWATNSILEFDARNGQFLRTFIPRPGDPGPMGPDDLLMLPNGRLAVCSQSENKVLEYDGTTGAFIRTWGSTSALCPLVTPAGLLANNDGSILVSSWSTHQVIRYAANGTCAGVFAFGGGLIQPQGLARHPNGNVLVSSRGSNQILEYHGETGQFVRTFASGNGLNEPVAIALGVIVPDCNASGIPDGCDIAGGASEDFNGDEIPDECGPDRGDLNCDGLVNLNDMGPFTLALVNPQAYAIAYPNCDRSFADVNADARIDGRDVREFVRLMVGP